ncbi:tetratricopeptide repeat protein [Spirulina sp. CCNP1310]|uniref:tetratricopeptide repeat protein n=1 Tax=Spirulina sp. CCNP1310 TaxID=3110249 RepID=UPI002B1F7AF3|nr:tetratricopeptide repeat protein [Spirulina sp. CCNP1310]MEA5421008.1 tetratricopeptide repeat protein [Spirulina sp. CCNP1310]
MVEDFGGDAMMDRALACRLGTFGAAVVVGTAASAIAAASLAPALPLLIAGTAGTALASVAAGLFANDLGGIDALGDPDLRNGHLTQAVGEAIALVIEDVAKNQEGRSRLALEALAQNARQNWPNIVKEILGDRTPAGLFEERLAANYFATAAERSSEVKALERWEDWRLVIDGLRPGARRWLRQSLGGRLRRWRAGGVYPLGALDQGLVDVVAQALHEQFPKAIREVLKRDFAAGKEAFAGMVFDLLGNVKAGQQDLAKQLAEWRAVTPSLSQALAEQLTADLQRLEGVVIEQGIETRNTVTEEGGKTRDTVTQEADRIISELKQPLPTPHSPLPPPTNLPQYRRTVPKFVGRDVAMDELTALVQECETVAIAAAVSGMGGLGKTELAWQWANREYEAGNFPGGVVWLDLAAGNPGEQLVLFYQTEFKVEIPAELTEVGQRVDYCWRHWLRPGAVLVVLDDVVRERDGAKLAMFGPGGVFRVLWTTREEWSGVKRYPLDQLSDGAARELLASYIDAARLDAEPEAVAGVLRWFGGSPLGLELAGRYLALYRPLKLANYLKSLTLTHQSLTKEKREEMGYPHGLEAALALSWERLESAAARRLALRWGLYGAAPIPLTEAEQVDGLEPLVALMNLSLVEQEGDAVRLHPLVRQFVRSRLGVELTPEEGEVLKREVAGAIVAQGRQIPDVFTMAQARDYAPWIPQLEEVAGELLPWVVDEDAIWPFISIARYYQGQGLYETAEPWRIQCVEIARKFLGDQDSDTAGVINSLALLYRLQGKYEKAEALINEALSIISEKSPSNHPHLVYFLRNLGGLYQLQGKYEKADPLYFKVLSIDRESQSLDSAALASSLNNLANLYRLQERYDEATVLFEEALSIHRISLTPKNSSLGMCLVNFAQCQGKQGNHESAESKMLEGIEILCDSLSFDHPKFQEKFQECINFYRTALAAGLPDTRLQAHPLGDTIRSRL